MGDTLWQRDEYFQVEPFKPGEPGGLLSVDAISYIMNFGKKRVVNNNTNSYLGTQR